MNRTLWIAAARIATLRFPCRLAVSLARRTALSWFHPTIAASPIAIDFGANTLKLMQLIPGPPMQWHAAAWIDVPTDLSNDPATRRAFCAEQLPRLLKSRPFIGRQCLCSLPVSDLLIQQIQLPANHDEPLEQAASQQLQQRLNLDMNRMIVRSCLVGQFTRDGRTTQEVVAMAARRDVVRAYLDMASRCRLDVLDLMAEPQAILAAFAEINRRQSDSQRITLYLDLGQASVKIIMAMGMQMQFAKVVYLPADKLVLTPPATAANAPSPLNIGIIPPSTRVNASVTAAQEGGIGGGEALDCLLDELHLSIRYVQAMRPQNPIDRIVFLGGKANDHALCQWLAQNLNLAAQLGDPVTRLPRSNHGPWPTELSENKPLPGWSVPLGLCLPPLSPQNASLNASTKQPLSKVAI